tara:strand:+ start:144 stop:539 length:396 start_codon:yes stop_codon:yes gene_type:complete
MNARPKSAPVVPVVSERAPLLSTAEAIDYLEAQGVTTSRRSLDALRAEGTLPWLKARGKIRILYRPADLLAAVLQEANQCSKSPNEKAEKVTTSAARSRDAAYLKALNASGGRMQKSTASAARPKSLQSIR